MGSAVTNSPNPSDGVPQSEEEKPMVVVIMGPTGAGKSRLAIDLAAHFPIEIINADSMQVYRGLDVLTNKVPLDEQKGENKLNSKFLSSLSVPILCSTCKLDWELCRSSSSSFGHCKSEGGIHGQTIP